jgi:hypothetical protein
MSFTTTTKLLKMQDKDFYLAIQRNRMNEALCNIKEVVPEKHIKSALADIRENTDIDLSPDDLRRILDLHPIVRGLLSKYDPECETDVRGSLRDMISSFFLGVSWPLRGDEIDMDAFLKLLLAQASAMGFVTN